jgi:hypothetical protein
MQGRSQLKHEKEEKKPNFPSLHGDVCSDLEPWYLCGILVAHDQSWCQSNIKTYLSAKDRSLFANGSNQVD